MLRYGIVCWLALSAFLLQARDYDLPSLLKLAEQNNKQIQLARADLKTASAEKLGAFSQALPTIDITAGYNRNLQENITFIRFGDEITPLQFSFANQFQINAVLRQTLFSFKVGMAIQAARYYDRLTNATFELTRQQVHTQVKTSFFGALLAREVMQVTRDSQESARDNYNNIKTKYEAGILSEFELLQSEVRWESSIPLTLSAQQSYASALNNLKVLAGIPIAETLELIGSLASYPALPEALPVDIAKEKRLDYNALQWEKKLQEKNASAQRSEFLPSLEGTFTYAYTASSDAFKLEQENDNYIVGLSLTIPVFSGGSRLANLRRAHADVDRVNTRIALADANIAAELENLQLRMGEAMQRIRATEKSVNTARRAFEIAETRVDNGLSTQVELKDSRVALDQSQVNYYSAIFDYLSAYYEWELATGRVNID